jgi:hypothetical protein
VSQVVRPMSGLGAVGLTHGAGRLGSGEVGRDARRLDGTAAVRSGGQPGDSEVGRMAGQRQGLG